MDIIHLIKHPEQMDRDTLYDLRSLLALYPYFQPARLLMLKNLYILHDNTFDEELRKAAIYINDRKKLFELVEASHYKLKQNKENNNIDKQQDENRTIELIDDFLDNIPNEEEKEKKEKRKPTPADAAIDYVSYLMEMEDEENNNDEKNCNEADLSPQLKGQSLIDNFISNDNGRIILRDEEECQIPEIDKNEEKTDDNESYFTETLAKIYIKQGRYSKALEIIKQLNLNYPKKNTYFADQIRFLEKLILNNNYKK